MANTLNLGTDGNWATKEDSLLAYNSENGNFKPLPFDFTRASSATVVNKDGLIETVVSGRPKIDFQGNTKGALLLEPSSTNLVTYSNDFSNSSWSKQSPSSISTNSVISPDGTLNASTFKSLLNSGGVILSTNIAKTAFIKYSFSFYVKKSNHRYIGLSMGTAKTSGSYNFYDFDTDTINNTIVSPQSAPITRELIGNGWVKLTQVFQMEDAAFLNSLTSLAMTDSSGSNTYTPSGTEEVYIYGAQLEQKSYPTSHIPTQGSAVTRVADVCNNGGNEQVINSTEGVLYAEISALDNDNTSRRISLSDSTSNNHISIDISEYTDTIIGRVRSSNIEYAFMVVSGINQTNTNKIALKYKSNDCSLWINGSKLATDTSVTMPIGLSELSIDKGQNSNPFYGNIKETKLYNTALTDSELQALTSN